MAKTQSSKSSGEPYSAQLPIPLLNALDTNTRISQYLIDNLPPEAWSAKLPDGKGRTIAAIVAHMDNVHVMWLKAAKADSIPDQLTRATVTPAGSACVGKQPGSVAQNLQPRARDGWTDQGLPS